MFSLDPFLREGKKVAQNQACLENKTLQENLQNDVQMFYKNLIRRKKKRNASILKRSEILSSRAVKNY